MNRSQANLISHFTLIYSFFLCRIGGGGVRLFLDYNIEGAVRSDSGVLNFWCKLWLWLGGCLSNLLLDCNSRNGLIDVHLGDNNWLSNVGLFHLSWTFGHWGGLVGGSWLLGVDWLLSKWSGDFWHLIFFSLFLGRESWSGGIDLEEFRGGWGSVFGGVGGVGSIASAVSAVSTVSSICGICSVGAISRVACGVSGSGSDGQASSIWCWKSSGSVGEDLVGIFNLFSISAINKDSGGISIGDSGVYVNPF
jgi:hypothetical protein